LLGWLVASPLATTIVNRKLAALPDFTGRVRTVKISFVRPSVTVHDFALFPRGKENDLPWVKTKQAKLGLAWRALLRGKLGGVAEVDEAELTAIQEPIPGESPEDREKREKREKKAEKKADGENSPAPDAEEKKEKVLRWQDVLTKAFPIELTKLEVKDTRVRFIDRTRSPVAEIGMEHLHIIATGLGNRPEKDAGPLPARLNLSATTTGNGRLTVALQLDPLAKQPRFKSTFELRDVSLPAMNNFLAAYANADVAAGTFELFIEVEAEGGAYQGYVKPFFKDLDFKTASDQDKSPGELIVKKTIAAVATVLKNKDEEKVATKAPFSGNFADNQVDVWTTIQNLFRNAFLQALREGFEGQTPSKA
jgi:hypothetical protein